MTLERPTDEQVQLTHNVQGSNIITDDISLAHLSQQLAAQTSNVRLRPKISRNKYGFTLV